MKTYRIFRSGANVLEELIYAMEGVKISHNRIHRFLLKKDLANPDPDKRKRRKWGWGEAAK